MSDESPRVSKTSITSLSSDSNRGLEAESLAESFSRARLAWSDILQVGELKVPAEDIVRVLGECMTPERRRRLAEVVDRRTLHFVSVLENIYDRGNVSAVMRSSEAFGFLQMNLIDPPGGRFKAANRVTRGAEKWLDVRGFTRAKDAVADLHRHGYQVWATDLNTNHSIDNIDWRHPTAVVLGNEKDGISEEMRGLVDGRFRIPMLGFSQSFNISVAAALIFYRAHMETRRLSARGEPGETGLHLSERQKRQLLANYYVRCFDNPEALLRRTLSRS